MDAYTGEVQIFGFPFAPLDWALCQGAVLNIQQNPALFSLIGATFGGNGSTTFALPNLAGQLTCAVGQGPGLTNHALGSQTGAMTVALGVGEMPSHNHVLHVFAQNTASLRRATPQAGDALASPQFAAYATGNPPAVGNLAAPLQPAGLGQAHANAQPYLAMNFCICLTGDFPLHP